MRQCYEVENPHDEGLIDGVRKAFGMAFNGCKKSGHRRVGVHFLFENVFLKGNEGKEGVSRRRLSERQ